MKYLCTVLFLAFAITTFAQDKPKPDRKSMTFQPNAKQPDGSATATPAPAPKPAEKAPENLPDKSAEKPKAVPSVITSTLPPGPAQIVHTFFHLLGQGDIDAAYTSLTKGSKIAERPDEIRTLKAKTKEAVEFFGTVHGYDLVDSKPVGERLVRATYISLGHDFPLRWRFYFYKSEEIWRLIDMRVDDKLSGIFEEPDEPRAGEGRP